MGTRAAFFIGDPRDVENRVWLGCIAFDGYPDGDCARFADARTPEEFRGMVDNLAATRKDFSGPEGGFPFPWTGNLFLTDCVYAFFDSAVHVDHNCGEYPGRNWRTVKWVLETPAEEQETWSEITEPDPGFTDVPAPGGGKWDTSKPDSIIIINS